MSPNRKIAHGRPCPYCGRQMERFHPKLDPTRDHVMPQSLGGTKIIICCAQCNHIKADMPPDVWAGFMAAHPGWWLLTKYELRAIRRGPKAESREAKWGPRRQRQGSPPTKPVVVPPGLIWSKTARPPWNNPELIAETVEQDARLRTIHDAHDRHAAASTDDAPPSQSGEACPP